MRYDITLSLAWEKTTLKQPTAIAMAKEGTRNQRGPKQRGGGTKWLHLVLTSWPSFDKKEGGNESGEKKGGWGVLIVMHGRSRMTIDPRILTTPGRSASGFLNKADIACTKLEAP